MIGKLLEKLEFLGVPYDVNDSDILEDMLHDSSRDILAEIGRHVLPVELESLAVDIAAGRYLLHKKATGTLSGFDIGTAVKQLQEGDTSITYALGTGDLTPEQRLDALIDYLRAIPPGLTAAWRKMRW